MANSITQEHGMGCGVACIAYILNISYQKALKLFSKPENAWIKGFWCKDLVSALHKGGKEYDFCAYEPSFRESLFRPGTIVFIERSTQYPAGHYLVRTVEGWMNPWINFPIICPALSGFQANLPGNPEYLIISQ